MINFVQSKYRHILADEFLADVTSTAHTETAFHPVFQGHDNMVMFIAEFFQNDSEIGYDEF